MRFLQFGRRIAKTPRLTSITVLFHHISTQSPSGDDADDVAARPRDLDRYFSVLEPVDPKTGKPTKKGPQAIREIDVLDASGAPLFSCVERGHPSDELRNELVEAAAKWEAASIAVHPAGTDRRHACCEPTLVERTIPEGRQAKWMRHDSKISGPEGWHRRLYGEDGSVIEEHTMEDLQLFEFLPYCNPQTGTLAKAASSWTIRSLDDDAESTPDASDESTAPPVPEPAAPGKGDSPHLEPEGSVEAE